MARTDVPLRLEDQDRSQVEEYRVADGRVEVRSLRSPTLCDFDESRWKALTPQQLSAHVERNTVVAQWLERRWGWRQLLQGCVGQQQTWTPSVEGVQRNAA